MKHLLASLALAAPTLAQSQVFVVDDQAGPGVDFTQLQDAIDAAAAAPGSLILLQDGEYAPPVLPFAPDSSFIVVASVRIVAAPGASPVLTSPLRLFGLDADESALFRGLVVDTSSSSSTGDVNALSVTSCDGVAYFESCMVLGPTDVLGVPPGESSHNVLIEDSNAVFVNCVVDGGFIAPSLLDGAPFGALRSDVHLYGTDIVVSTPPLLLSVAGIGLQGSFLFASGGSIVGGRGHDGSVNPIFGPSCASDGGPGIALVDGGAPSEVTVLGVDVQGGPPGDDFTCGMAQQGPPFLIENGSVDSLPGSARTISTPPTTVAGGSVTVPHAGEAAELLVLIVSTDAAALHLPSLAGTLVTALPLYTELVGVTDAAGNFDLSFPAPAPTALTDARTLVFQTAFASANGVVLSNPSLTTFLAAP